MAKPVYNAVIKHGAGKPVIVIVPSKRQAQLTAIDLMTYHETIAGRSFRGTNASSDQLQEVLESFREGVIKQVLTNGVGFVHGGMNDEEKEKVCSLFREEILSVLVCPADQCWTLQERAHLVVIMGTEIYDGRERRYVSYPVADLLHMMGRACRQGLDENGKCVILCHSPKKMHLKKLLYEPLPIESHLHQYLHDHMNSEITAKTISSMQDAIDYITWTFLYRRLTKNPNYYNLQGTSNVHLSEHMSEMIESVLGDLSESKCCQADDDGEVSPLNLGLIAAYYYIQYTTVELMASSITPKTKIRGIIEILSAASEFSSFPIRHGEEKSLQILTRTLSLKLPDSAQYNDANTKALILLQSHFSRKTLSTDLYFDKKSILVESINLIQAIVDVISSNGWLKPALAAMELSQMVVQGLWSKDNVLLQIPHCTNEIIKRCEAYEGEEPIESIFDILSIEDDARNDIFRLSNDKMADVAAFCNNYPSIDVTFKVEDQNDITAGDPVRIHVQLEREVDEEDLEEMDATLGLVSAPLFPKEKREGWWVVIGDLSSNTLLSLKRLNLQHKQKVTLEFLAPEEPGDHNMTLFCISDSYLGCDQEFSLPLSVAANDSDDDDDDDDEED